MIKHSAEEVHPENFKYPKDSQPLKLLDKSECAEWQQVQEFSFDSRWSPILTRYLLPIRLKRIQLHIYLVRFETLNHKIENISELNNNQQRNVKHQDFPLKSKNYQYAISKCLHDGDQRNILVPECINGVVRHENQLAQQVINIQETVPIVAFLLLHLLDKLLILVHFFEAYFWHVEVRALAWAESVLYLGKFLLVSTFRALPGEGHPVHDRTASFVKVAR